MKRKSCSDYRTEIQSKISKMLASTSTQNSDGDEIDALMTPPFKGDKWFHVETPTTESEHLEMSFTEISRKPFGRFLSFDVKRSLFSGKRQAEEADDTPTGKRLREAEAGISYVSIQALSPRSENVDVKDVVHRLSTDEDVIADGSRPYTLPTITGKHSDLKTISPETMNDVLNGCYDDKIDHVTVIDCRYPYEFEGGHIKGAVNLYTRTAVEEFLLRHSGSFASSKKHVLVFHCEFSSERGPKLYRHLRSEDRAMNKDHYPRLNFPEVYVLEGGYKAFFHKFMISKMLASTSTQNSDGDEIDALMTPPFKGDKWFHVETPTTESEHLDMSFTEISRKPIGRFLSFDVKRSLFSGKRLAEEDDTPSGKRLREALSPRSKNVDVKDVVHRLSSDEDVIADGSRPYILPTIAGKHSDLKTISPDTMNDVLRGCYDDKIDHVTVIDCRYPYEFDGGHIKGAVNLYTHAAIEEFLLRHGGSFTSSKKHALVFHCEYSSERGPKMYRHLRSKDRAMNKDHYPRLNFPEVYVLEGGYKAFFYKFVTQCLPQTYKPMLHKDHAADLRHFRGKSKSWTAGERPQLMRTTLRF